MEQVSIILEAAIKRLLNSQKGDGSWDGSNFGGPMYTAMWLINVSYIGELNVEEKQLAVNYLLSELKADGSYPASPSCENGDLNASARVYAALKVAGISDNSTEQMQTRAYILLHGGFDSCDPITKIELVLAGLLEPESLGPATLIHKMIPNLDKYLTKHFGIEMTMVGVNFFPAILFGLHDKSKLPTRIKKQLINNLKSYMAEAQNPNGNLVGVIFPVLNVLTIYHLLGMDKSDAVYLKALNSLNLWKIFSDGELKIQPCYGVAWNTAAACQALLRYGLPVQSNVIQKAKKYLLSVQTVYPYHTSFNPSLCSPGGWNYQGDCPKFPDNDTSGYVLHTLGLMKQLGDSDTKMLAAIDLGTRWLINRQNNDGGWSAFTPGHKGKPAGPMFKKNIEEQKYNVIEAIKLFVDTPPEVRDPSTEGLTARALKGLAELGYSNRQDVIKCAVYFLKAQRDDNHLWWGRWICNYLITSSYVIQGLSAVGESMSQPIIQNALTKIRQLQNSDGGWGETADSYQDSSKAGRGASLTAVTASVCIALMNAENKISKEVQRGIEYICSNVDPKLSPEPQALYVIALPSMFYSNPIYSQTFVIEALATYRDLSEKSYECV